MLQSRQWTYKGRRITGEGDGKITVPYVYLYGVPVAKVELRPSKGLSNNARIFAIHTDRLGTSQAMIDNEQAVVWRGIVEPFGKAKFQASANDDGNVLNATCAGLASV
jgi:hypothetical protein